MDADISPPAPVNEVPCLVPKGNLSGTPVRMIPTQRLAQVARSAFLSLLLPRGALQKGPLCQGHNEMTI